MAYTYDLFVSYSHGGSVLEWVRNHFHSTLAECLTDVMPRNPAIFIDYEQETGVHWPNSLRHALSESRFMVAVLSPPYFRSSWCLAEWETMRQRESIEGLRTHKNPRGLIHAISYADGEHFSEDAKQTQYRQMNRFAIPVPVFRESREFVLFYQEMRNLAAEVAKQIDRAPAWVETWPVVTPPSVDEPAVPLPRL